MPKVSTKVTKKFKFKELVDVDIIERRRKKLDPNTESYLVECFNKWTTMNCSMEFLSLRRELCDKILTLGLLIAHEEEVVGILLGRLEVSTALSALTCLDLLRAAVDDLGSDMVQYLPRVFTIIGELLNRIGQSDDEVVRTAFECMQYLLISLIRDVTKQPQMVMNLLQPFVADRRSYIRELAGQCLSSVLVRMKDISMMFRDNVIPFCVTLNEKKGAFVIANVMEHCLRRANTLRSTFDHPLRLFYNIFEENNLQYQLCQDAFPQMLKRLLMKLEAPDVSKIWTAFLGCISQSTNTEMGLKALTMLFDNCNPKKLILISSSIIQKMKSAITETPTEKALDIVKILLEKLPVSDDLLGLLRSVILLPRFSIEGKFDLISLYIADPQITLFLQHAMNTFINDYITTEILNHDLKQLLRCMYKVVLAKSISANDQSNNSVDFRLFTLTDKNTEVEEVLLGVLKGDPEPDILWLVYGCLPYICPINSDSLFVDAIVDRINRISVSEEQPNLLMTLLVAFDCLTKLNAIQERSINASLGTGTFLEMLAGHNYPISMEPVLMDLAASALSLETNPATFKTYMNILIDRLRSASSITRRCAAQALRYFTEEKFDDALNTICLLESIISRGEQHVALQERAVCRQVLQLHWKVDMTDGVSQLVLSYLIGALHVRISSIIRSISSAIVSFVNSDRLTNPQLKSNEDILWLLIESNIATLTDTDEDQFVYPSPLNRYHVTENLTVSRRPNWQGYRLRLIRLLSQMPRLAGRKTKVLSPLLVQLFSMASHSRHTNETLSALLDVYSKIPNITSCANERTLNGMFHQALSRRDTSVQRAAVTVLLNYRQPELMAYRDQLIEAVEGGRDSLSRLAVISIERQHHVVVIPIIVRLLAGKLKATAGVRKKNKYLIHYAQQLDATAIGLLVEVLMDGLEDVRRVVKEALASGTIGQMRGTFRALQSFCGSLHSLLVACAFKLDNNQLDKLLTVVVDAYWCCSVVRGRYGVTDDAEEHMEAVTEMDEDDEQDEQDATEANENEPMETNENEQQDDSNEQDVSTSIPQAKQVRQTCTKIIMFFFNKLINFQWSQERLKQFADDIVTIQEPYMVVDSVTSMTLTGRLAVLWSARADLLYMITDGLFDAFVTLLNNPKTDRVAVSSRLITILYNVVVVHGRNDLPAVRRNLPALMHYLDERISSLRTAKTLKLSSKEEFGPGAVFRRELALVCQCVRVLMEENEMERDEKAMQTMASSILTYLYNTNKLSIVATALSRVTDDEAVEQTEVDLLRALHVLLNALPITTIYSLTERAIGLFARLTRRASRTVLADAVSELWLKIGQGIMTVPSMPSLGRTVTLLNSWNEKRLAEMDYDKVSCALDEVSAFLRMHPINEITVGIDLLQYGTQTHPLLWSVLTAALHCCYLLARADEIGMRQTASDCLETILSSVATAANDRLTNGLFLSSVWPAICNGLRCTREIIHYEFVKMARHAICCFYMLPRLADLAGLVQFEKDQKSFFDRAVSMTPALIADAMRLLKRFVDKHDISESSVMEVLLPIIQFRINIAFARDGSKVQQDGLAALHALTSLARHLPEAAYVRMVNEQIAKLDATDNKSVDLTVKTLIALLEAYVGGMEEAMLTAATKLEAHIGRRNKHQARGQQQQGSGNHLQVPVAIALVRMAVRMPRRHLKGIISKTVIRICDFLKSEDADMRKQAGQTLLLMLDVLKDTDDNMRGCTEPPFFGFIVGTVRAHLDRGFQRHVALFTIHKLLTKLDEKGAFAGRQLHQSTVDCLLEMYLDEMFGEMAKEREERQAAEKALSVPEARNPKAYEGMRLLASLVTVKQLLPLLRSVSDAGTVLRSRVNLKKLEQILTMMASTGGLLKNCRLDVEALFTVAAMLVIDSTEGLCSTEGQAKLRAATGQTQTSADLHLYTPARRLDGYDTPLVTVGTHGHAHLLTACGLDLLHRLAKNPPTTVNIAAMLEPVVAPVLRILREVQHKPVLVAAVRCLKQMAVVSPPSLIASVEDACVTMFRLQQHVSGVDTNTGNGRSMRILINDTLATIIDRYAIQLTDDQYDIVLCGIQLDTTEDGQMTSLALLRAVIDRRICEPTVLKQEAVSIKTTLDVRDHLRTIMGRVKEIALTAPMDKTMEDARRTVLMYLRRNKHDDEYVEMLLVDLLRQLPILDERGRLSTALLLMSIGEQKATLFSKHAVHIVACILIVLRRSTDDWSMRVDEALGLVVERAMRLLNSDGRADTFTMVMEQLGRTTFTEGAYRAPMRLLTVIERTVRCDQDSIGMRLRLLNQVLADIIVLVKHRATVNRQISAAGGVDKDLMDSLGMAPKEIEVIDNDDSSNDNDNDCGDDNEDDNQMANNNKYNFGYQDDLCTRMTIANNNLYAALRTVASFLDADKSNEADIECLRQLLRARTTWYSMFDLLSGDNVKLRKSVCREIIQTALKWELEFVLPAECSLVIDEKAMETLMKQSFRLLELSNIDEDDCDGAVTNAVLLWQIITDRFEGECRSEMYGKLVSYANRVIIREIKEGKSIVRRCAVLKFMAAICGKSILEDLTKKHLEHTLVWMWLRENRQCQIEVGNTKYRKRKRNSLHDYLSEKDIHDWAKLVDDVGDVLIKCLTEEVFNKLKVSILKEKAIAKHKRKVDECANIVSDPATALLKKRKKTTTEKGAKKPKM